MEQQDNRKLYVQVFDKIRRYIVENQLTAGDKLPTELKLCSEFSVSRNVLREAVKTLELMGVVKSAPGIGIIVQEYSMDFMFQQMFYFLVSDSTTLLREILELRKALELGFARAAFDSITPADAKELMEIVDRMGAKLLRNKIFREEDMQFHLKLFGRVNNKMLGAIFYAAWDADSNFNPEEKKDYFAVYLNHVDIAEALQQKNYSAYEKAMELHFSEAEYVKKEGRIQKL